MGATLGSTRGRTSPAVQHPEGRERESWMICGPTDDDDDDGQNALPSDTLSSQERGFIPEGVSVSDKMINF